MLILIHKDSATKVPREVKDLEEAQSFALQGFPVSVVADGGEISLEEALQREEAGKQPEEAVAQPAGFVAKVKAAVTRKK